MKRLIFLILALSYAVPAYAQPSQQHVVDKAVQEGYLRKCQQHESAEAKRGCALFTRLVAFRLQHLGWGLLTKSPGENNVDGYAVDAIVHRDTLQVIDIIGATETPGAGPAWIPQPRRPHNLYAVPIPLTAEEMAFLGGSSQPVPQPGPVTPTPAPVDLSAVYARLDVLEREVSLIKLDTADIRRLITNETMDIRAIIATLPQTFPVYKGGLWGISIISRPCPTCK